MLDDGDATDIFLLGGGGGVLWTIIMIAVVVVVLVAVHFNKEECEAKSCPDGSRAALLDHECVCVSKPR